MNSSPGEEGLTYLNPYLKHIKICMHLMHKISNSLSEKSTDGNIFADKCKKQSGARKNVRGGG